MATVTCPTCGKEYDAATQFCPQDGSTLHPANRKSGGRTPAGGIGTLVGTRGTSEQDAQEIKEALAASREGRGRPGGATPVRPTDPLSRPSMAEEPKRSVLGIAITVGVVLVIVAVIAFAMRR